MMTPEHAAHVPCDDRGWAERNIRDQLAVPEEIQGINAVQESNELQPYKFHNIIRRLAFFNGITPNMMHEALHFRSKSRGQ